MSDESTSLSIEYPDGILPIYYRRQGECQSARALLHLDPEADPPRLYLTTGRYQGDGTPVKEWHDRAYTWPVSEYLSASDCEWLLDRVAPLARRIVEGYGSHWDGGNYRGELTEDAREASQEIQWLCDETESDGSMTVWEPGDWIADSDLLDLIRPVETLYAACRRITREAIADGVYLDGDLERALRRRVEDAIICPCGSALDLPADTADWGAWVRAAHKCGACEE